MNSYLTVFALLVACTTTQNVLLTTTEGRNYTDCETILSANGGTKVYSCPWTFSGYINPADKIELDQEVKIGVTETAASWGLDRIDQKNLPLDGQYSYGTYQGQGVNVYVIDTGILTTHPEFEGRAFFLSNHVTDGITTDCNGHGTHVAGTIMSKSYGVAKKANAYAVRVFGCTGGSSFETVIAGMNSAIAHAQSTGKPSILSMSLSGGSSTAVKAAVKAATDAGIHVIVAAGNDAVDACTRSPADAPSAITVMASDKNDVFAWFSNFGTCTDIIAPGVDITSTWLSNGINTISGTSMATPHVSGVAALLLSEKTYTVSELTTKLTTLAVPNKITSLVPVSPNLLLQVPPISVTPPPPPPPPPTTVNCAGKHGDMYCDPTNKFKFVVCNWGNAIYMDVAAGTKCAQTSPTSITLVFA
jgi:subtilisin family serine protease